MDLPKIKAVLYTGKTYSDGTHPIMIRVTQNRKSTYKSVGHSVSPDAWDDDTQNVYEKRPQITKRQEGQLNQQKIADLIEKYKHAVVLHNAKTINTAIKDKMAEIEGVSEKLKVNDEVIDLKTIKARLSNKEAVNRNSSFIVYGSEMKEAYLKAGAIGTYKNYKSILTKLEEYLKNKDLKFAEVTVLFLQDYRAYLTTLGNKPNTIYNNLKTIRAIYYSALAEGLVATDKNPFFVFKLKWDSNIRKDKLTVEEIVAIEKLVLKDDSLVYHVRNFFLFSFYCAGIRASDVLQLKWSNIVNDRCEYNMDKTGTYKSIGLIPKAKEILKLYKTTKSKADDFVFPFIDGTLDLSSKSVLYNQVSAGTAVVNKYLKELAKTASIHKVLSTHIARHSFADIARTRKASVYDISKMLGHSSIKVTEAYLASFDVDSQDEAMKNILNF